MVSGAREVCTNGIDDDCDGLTDSQDPSCQTPPGWGAAAQASTGDGMGGGGAASVVANWIALLLLVVCLIFVQRLRTRD